MDPTPHFTDEGTYSPDNLLSGEFPTVTEEVTIVTGSGVLARGTVLGKITATGKYTTSLAAAADGSEVPDMILAQDVDATAADKVVTAYAAGAFNVRALTIGAGHTAAAIKAGLRALGIYLRGSVAA